MHWVKKINYIEGYKISLTFNDKKIKVVDVEPYLDGGIFLDLKDPKYFKRVRVVEGTIVWPNEADFCPDVLYEIGVEMKEPPKKNSRQKATPSVSARSKPRITAI